MRSSTSGPSLRWLDLARSAVRFSVLVALAAVICLPGCKGKGIKSKLSGKVTLNGKNVMGTVVFLGSDGKEVMAPISPADGTYTAANVPVGEAKVMVKGLGGVVGGRPPAAVGGGGKGGPPMPSVPGQDALPPPAKYSNPNNGLKVDVKGGDQTYDIELKP